MADIFRRIKILFDRDSARKANEQLVQAFSSAGKKAGESFVREVHEAFTRRMALLKVQLAEGLISKAEFKRQAELAAKEFNAGIVKGMKQAHEAGKLTDKEFIKLSRTLKRTGDEGALSGRRIEMAFAKLGAFFATTFTIDKVVRFFKGSIDAALQAEESISRLNSVLQPLGMNYREVGREVEGFLDRIQATTKFSDEDAREALTVLVTATGDYNKSLRLLDVTAKIAEKRQVTMSEAAKTAADASKGLTRGMRDLGISAKETGDIVEKINLALGNIAEEAGGENAGKIKRAANLWDEFQEKLGLAIIGSEGFQTSGEGLIDLLIEMNTWMDRNAKIISAVTNALFDLGRMALRIGPMITQALTRPGSITGITSWFRFGRDLAKDAMTPDSHEDIREGIPGPPKPTPRRLPPEDAADEGRMSAAERKALRDREGLEHDIRVASFMLEEQATREFAEAEIRKLEMLGQVGKVAFGTLEEGFKRLQDLNLQLAVAGFDKTLIPQVQRTEHAFEMLPPVMETMAAGMQKVVDQQAQLAEQFSTPWLDAMGIIRNEVEGQGTLFIELGEAWAFGGFKGIIELAKHKVKENLAFVIENLAKAFGSFALGNPASATLHLKAAAQHGLAATAWKALAATGGGSSGSASAGGSTGSSSASSASNLERPESQISIYLTGPGWHALNPEVQRVVHQAGEMARERHGSNTKVRVIRGGR